MNVDDYQRSISKGYRRAQLECAGVLAAMALASAAFLAWHAVMQ